MALATMLDEMAVCVRVRSGMFLFRADDNSAGVYVVRHGRIALLWQSGEVWPMDVVERGSVIGLAAAINGICNLGAKVVEDAELGFVPRNMFLRLLESNPAFSAAVTEQLGKEIARMRAIAAAARTMLG
jgi:CRP-like cAMP-binding protein